MSPSKLPEHPLDMRDSARQGHQAYIYVLTQGQRLGILPIVKFRQPLTDSDYLSVRCSLHVFERDMIVLIKSGTFTVSSAISMSPCQSLLLSVGGARARARRASHMYFPRYSIG